MRVLGVDPGLTRCGVAVVDGARGRTPHLVAATVLTSAASLTHPERLLHIWDGLEELVERHRPDAVAVEQVFSQHNLRTVLGTAQVAGLVMIAAQRRGLAVGTHTPTEVKAAVTGHGRAGKEQVGRMVMRLLGLPERPEPADVSDAMALAICHLWRAGVEAGRR